MTTNYELLDMIKKLGICNFKGIIMKDEFAKLDDPWDTEYGIYNLQDSDETGSHWAAWCHKSNKWYHFCPYGADGPKEFITYCRRVRGGKEPGQILSSTFQIQKFGTSVCGQLCILLIYLLDQDIEFEQAVISML
jgi:hypothetical protein